MTWSDVDWAATEAAVGRIQNRIFRAAKTGDGARVKNLQKLLARSRSAKLLAVRQVTQRNAGRTTPGIDGVVCRTLEDRVTLLESGLDLTGYKPKPVRRVYIPKANGKLRPLGIPTVKDRVMVLDGRRWRCVAGTSDHRDPFRQETASWCCSEGVARALLPRKCG